MPDKTKKISPPYASFSAFLGFLNKLRETAIPGRIDASVFGNASGTLSYSIIASLRYLKLIDANGVPKERLVQIVNASDEDRKGLLAPVIKEAYPTLFSDGVDLTTMTAGQFDEHVREVFEAHGSTVDKIAAFFIGAANHTGIEISPHLKARKPIAASSGSRKSARQRKQSNNSGTGGGGNEIPPQSPPAPNVAKPLQYQLIDLMGEPDIGDEVKGSIWSLVQYLMEREKRKAAEHDDDESAS